VAGTPRRGKSEKKVGEKAAPIAWNRSICYILRVIIFFFFNGPGGAENLGNYGLALKYS